MKKEILDLVEKLRNTEELKQFGGRLCREHGSEAVVDDSIASWYNLKPDDFYNSQRVGKRPPAVDCLITCQCKKHKYDHYLVELKSAETSLTNEWDQIYRKFENTIEKFMFTDFANIFLIQSAFAIRLVVVHRIKEYDLQLATKKLFSESLKIQNLTLYIGLEQSPYTIKKC